MAKQTPQAQARKKAELILRVRAGLMTATEAARELGISRKTYYKWEQRGLAAMLEGLCERSSGRPPSASDGRSDQQQKKIRELEKELEQKRKAEELRRLVNDMAEKKG